MANEFVVRKGLISSGSINVSGSVTASQFIGTASWATHAVTASAATSITFVPTTSSYAITASYALNAGSGTGGTSNTSVVVDSYTFIGDGVTTQYQVSKSYSDTSLIVAVGGLTYIIPDDYSVSASTITFVEAPTSASNISVKALVNTIQSATGSFSGSFFGDGSGLSNIAAPLSIETHTFDADGFTSSFSLGKTYPANSLIVSVDGLIYTNPTDYTLAGNNLVFVDMPVSGSTILARVFVNVTNNATGSFSGSFLGDGSQLTNLPTPQIDNYTFVGDGTTKNFVLSQSYNSTSVDVFVAGIAYTTPDDYSISGTMLSLVSTPPSGSNILVKALVTATGQITGSFSGSFNGIFNGSLLTASFATTSSNLNGGTTNYIPLWTSATVQSSSIIFQNAGNIGIDNTNPGSKLDINQSVGNTLALNLYGSTATGQSFGQRIYAGTNSSDYALSIRDRGDASSYLYVRGDGNVGIGTTNPTSKLHVNYGIRLDDGLNTSGSDIYANSSHIYVGSGGGGATWQYNANRGLDLWQYSTGESWARTTTFTRDGNVGIGITTPSSSLHVNGIFTTKNVVENIIITGSGPTSALTVDLTSGSLQYRSGSTTAHWTTNFRWDAATTLNSVLYPGQSITVTLIVNNATTAYSASTHQVDGKSFTPRWQGRTIPSASANSTDMYTYTIVKLASASYDIFASQTTFG